jgi:ABC-type iron transport system FetAB permease component
VIAFFRLLAILLALSIMYMGAAYVVTRERKYLDRAWILVKIGVAGGFIFFGVLFIQRIWFDGP